MKKLALLTSLWTAVGLLGATNASAQDIRQGLVSYWPFETITNGNATPDVCFGNDLLFQGTMTATNLIPAGGKYGNAFFFNGPSNQCLGIALTNIASPNPGLPLYDAKRYSVALWVKGGSVSANNNRSLFAEGATNSTTPLMLVGTRATSTPKEPNMVIRGSATFVNNVFPTNIILDNNWHHLAWVDDFGAAKIYVDGILATNFTYSPGPIALNTIAVGGALRAGAVTLPFTGYLDEVGLWERALSQADVQNVMSNAIVGPVPAFAPFFNLPPTGSTNAQGDRLLLNGIAAGTRPLFYQWSKAGNPIPGATNQSLVFTNLAVADSGDYAIIVSNSVNSITSSPATVLVSADPSPTLSSGIVSYWPFDTGATSTPDPYGHNDMNFNQMDGNNFVPRAATQFTNALQFNGTNQHLNRVGGSPIYNNPVYTVAFWVNGSVATQTNKAAFSEGCSTNATPYFSLGTDSGGTNPGLDAFIRNPGNTALVNHRKSTTPVFDGNWHHIAWTDSNGVVKLYIDGFLDATDFNYTREALPLDVTGVGAILRNTPTSYFAGSVDELAVWTRKLTYTEIQQLISTGIPFPVSAVMPSITVHPSGTNVFSQGNVTMVAQATGTSPLAYLWQKDGSPLGGSTTNSLLLSNIQTNQSGAYTMVVTNEAGSVTSSVANVIVTLRPSTPETLAFDFNERVAQAPTESGFQPFLLGGSGVQSVSIVRLFGGAEVTVARAGSATTLDDRVRSSPTNRVEFTEQNLLQDFIFSTSTNAGTGLDVLLAYLKTNQLYKLTLWSFDTGNTGTRVADWSVNSVLTWDNYTFNGNIWPASNSQYRMSANVLSDATGKLLVSGRIDSSSAGISVFLNALKIEIPPPQILGMTSDGTTLTLNFFTPNPEVTQIEAAADLNGSPWQNVSSGPYTGGPNTFQAQFLQSNGYRFYRLVRSPIP